MRQTSLGATDAPVFNPTFLLQRNTRRNGAATGGSPDSRQFWQGRRSRLHDRLRYTQQAQGGWLRERLAP